MRKQDHKYRYQVGLTMLFHTVMAAMFLCGLLACSAEESVISEPDPDEGLERVEVPITIGMGSGWDVDSDETRAAPPGVGTITSDGNVTITENSQPDAGWDEIKNVDVVDIVVFRRKVGSEGDFQYDERNRQKRPFVEEGGKYDDQFGDYEKHKVATGRLIKVYGYEYRVVAVAYSTTAPTPYKDAAGNNLFGRTDGDLYRFTYNDLYAQPNFSDFKAILSEGGINVKGRDDWKKYVYEYENPYATHPYTDILNQKITDNPQLFFGECYTDFNGKRSDIIQYSETDKNGDEVKEISLKGLLFRGMAKVEIRVKPTQYTATAAVESQPVSMLSLLAKNVLTAVKLTDYDDFLKGENPVAIEKHNATMADGEYTVTTYCALSKPDVNNFVVLEAYFLPCKTRLAIRVCHEQAGIYVQHFRNGYLNYKDSDWTGIGNGTGIISPITHDGEFYLRRNHKYVITINDLDQFLRDYSKEDSKYQPK